MLTAAAILTILPLLAQTPSFEVATVKPASGDPNMSNYARLRHGTLSAENVTLQTLLSVAYGLNANRITGLAWIDTDRFDLSGKAPVVDKIDLPGPFSYVLSFTPASRLDKATDDSPPDLFTAIQQQLGLKLEPKKATLEILVVDQASRTPTPN